MAASPGGGDHWRLPADASALNSHRFAGATLPEGPTGPVWDLAFCEQSCVVTSPGRDQDHSEYVSPDLAQ